MFAISRDGDKVFLHEPDAGMAVPVVLDMRRDAIDVRVPSLDELENDFAVYDDLDEILRHVAASQREKVSFAQSYSTAFSTAFRSRIKSGKLTVAELRDLVEDYVRRAAGPDPSLPVPAATAAFTQHLRAD